MFIHWDGKGRVLSFCLRGVGSIEIGLVAEPAFDRTDIVQHEPQIPLEALNINSRAHLRIETKINNKNFGVGVSEVAGCGAVQELASDPRVFGLRSGRSG